MERYITAFLARDPFFLRVGIGLALLLRGIWLASPWDSFDGSRAFDQMGALAPEWVWAIAFIVVGLAVFFEGRLWPRVCYALNLGVAALWGWQAYLTGYFWFSPVWTDFLLFAAGAVVLTAVTEAQR